MEPARLDPTLIAVRSIVSDRDLRGEFVFEMIGQAGNRTTSDEDSAARLRQLAADLAERRVLGARAPGLQALWLIGELEAVDWLQVVAALQGRLR